MKKLIYISLTVAYLLVFVGCTQLDNLSKNSNDNKRVKVTQKMLFHGYSNYAKIINNDGEIVGYYSIKQNPLEKNELFFKAPFIQTNENSTQMQSIVSVQQIDFIVNNINAKELAGQLSVYAQPYNKQLFGNNVTFSLLNGNTGSSSNTAMNAPAFAPESGNNIDMYVPDLLDITFPTITKSNGMLPYCYYKDFVLRWNADPKNENGLVVVVEWDGTDIYGTGYKEYVRNADVITSDNGECVLKNEIFDGIPQGAFAKITLLRGNIEVTEVTSEGKPQTFIVVAASEAILPFIMVKEIGN